jgi:hypothetical protein
VRGLDHRHVVRAVADRERDALDAELDELDDLHLLLRAHAAADDRLAARGNLKPEVRVGAKGREKK